MCPLWRRLGRRLIGGCGFADAFLPSPSSVARFGAGLGWDGLTPPPGARVSNRSCGPASSSFSATTGLGALASASNPSATLCARDPLGLVIVVVFLVGVLGVVFPPAFFFQFGWLSFGGFLPLFVAVGPPTVPVRWVSVFLPPLVGLFLVFLSF